MVDRTRDSESNMSKASHIFPQHINGRLLFHANDSCLTNFARGCETDNANSVLGNATRDIQRARIPKSSNVFSALQFNLLPTTLAQWHWHWHWHWRCRASSLCVMQFRFSRVVRHAFPVSYVVCGAIPAFPFVIRYSRVAWHLFRGHIMIAAQRRAARQTQLQSTASGVRTKHGTAQLHT